jgi:1,4-dihydroxy-6-naphthoate synthase
MDDAFMFYAIATGRVPLNGWRVEHVVEDIQSLNRRAQQAQLDVTAISAASYPDLKRHYWILSVGSSVGRGYGPLVISRQPQDPEGLHGRRVAVPGLKTTAALLLRLAMPGCRPVERPFADIPEAVLRGEVQAGVVIHEWQLTYRDAGLLPVLDLGLWWARETRLPLPLGLNVVRKELGRRTAGKVAALLHSSIAYALAHQDEAVAYAMRYGRGTDAVRSRQFIGMYVNEDSLTLNPPCRKALRELFRRARAAGALERVPRLSVIEPAGG